VLRLFQPDRNPDEIKPKRTYAKRTRYFARNELARLCMDALRDAPGIGSRKDQSGLFPGNILCCRDEGYWATDFGGPIMSLFMIL